MQFSKIELNIDSCCCFKDAFEDTEGIYTKRIKKNNPNLAGDFKTKWEKNTTIDNEEPNCDELCSNIKSLSINRLDGKNEEEILKKYKALFAQNNRQDAMLVFKLRAGSGYIKKTPTKSDSSHCDFYRSDDFSLDMLDIIKTVPLT